MLNLPKVLLLNYSYEPIMVVSIKRAIILYFLEKVDMVEKSDNFINSLYLSIPVPYVIKLKNYLYLKPKGLSLTRKNILKRDEGKCQYCGTKNKSMKLIILFLRIKVERTDGKI